MDLFLFKKIVSVFLDPVPVVLMILVLAWLMLLWARRGRSSLLENSGEVLADYSVPRKRRKPGALAMFSIFFAALLLYVSSIGWGMNQLFFALERQYPPLQIDQQQVGDLHPDFIVILSGSHVYFPERPITSRLAGATTARLIEGLRLQRQFPDAKLVMLGGVMKEGWPSVASEMGEMAKMLGYEGEVLLEEASRDTKENAILSKEILHDKSFILVTSGYHMPRAMGLFRGQGLQPIAGAADIRRWPRNNYQHDQLIPSSKNLSRLSVALHEYLGFWWATLRGQLGEVEESETEESSETKGKFEEAEQGPSV